MKKFYVTTPIYYVTARPHLGSLYSTVLADVASRWFKLKGYKTFFLTGTDEHGQKVAQAAELVQKQTKEFVDSFIPAYKDLWHKFHIEYDSFIRTTDKSHVEAVQNWIRDLQEKGDIYKDFYEGLYCTPCETFVDKESTLCPTCSRPTQIVSEESYFFKLSAYQDKLLKFYETHPNFIVPSERAQEIINFVKKGLKDLSISRTTITWGIPFPGDTKHVTYVWADALNNYITAIGYGNKAKQEEFDFWWPADLQIMGKDILRFHAIYWPAFLMASNLELPKSLLVHGWIKVNQQKMSKSFGNVVDPQQLLDLYGADPIRYYLVRHMAITQDSDFSIADLEKRLSTDLANDLGNLLNRMTTLAYKFNSIEISPVTNWGPKEIDLRGSFWTCVENVSMDMEDYYFYRALHTAWGYINQVNAYFHEQEPWKVAAKDMDRFKEIISATCHSLYGIAILLWPVMPKKMEELLKSLGKDLVLGSDLIEELKENPWNKSFLLTKIEPLFVKFETKETVMEEKVIESNLINFDDFKKVMLVVGTIDQCETIEKSDKLYKLQVNFGDKGVKQILSGIRQFYKPEDLIGKQAIFVYNLQPRQMMGLESHGMILTAAPAARLLSPIEPVANGTQLQ